MPKAQAKQETASKAPTHIAYHVKDIGKDDSIWTRIGCAWPHTDGKGFNIQMDVLPIDGRISLRTTPEEKS